MSMEVDLNTPLTDDERSYLLMRGRLADIERADSLNGTETPPAPDGDGTGPKLQPLMTGEQRVNRKAQLLEELRLIEAQEGGADDSDDEEPAPYEEWTHKELDAELKRRQLTGGGTKEEKAERLYANDEQQAAETAQV